MPDPEPYVVKRDGAPASARRKSTKRADIKRGARILKSGLTGSWYLVTRWVELRDGEGIEAKEKLDVTDQIRAIIGSTAGDLWNAAHNALDDLPEGETKVQLALAIDTYEKETGL